MSNVRQKGNKRITTKKLPPNKSVNCVGDVTIGDFANSSRPSSRFKKATTKVSYTVKEQITVEKDETQEWDEAEESALNKELEACSVKPRRRRRAKLDEDIEEEGVDYPLDLWFIISEYITPEDVGKFARICKSSYYVVTTKTFWFSLYKSYYKFLPGIPERLQPQCMVRQYGLRAAVIRSLHYTYFPLHRGKCASSFLQQKAPHSLIQRRCILMWHREIEGRWHFFFKLKEISKKRGIPLIQSEMNDCIEKHCFDTSSQDIIANKEEGCKLLRVTCLKYSMLPVVIGFILQKVSINLLQNCKDQKLQLTFGTSNVPNSQTVQVILNEFVGYQIVNWWHPCYPHQDAVSDVQLVTRDTWDSK